MTAITAWRTDEPCPVCATGLILHDDGSSPAWVECRLCGWADTWTSDEPAEVVTSDRRCPAVRTTRAQRMAMPLAREVVKDLAVEHGACIRPIQLRRTNLDTGEADTVLVPCGHTLAHVCPSCAERARTLRAAQCREGWHLEDEPDLDPRPGHRGPEVVGRETRRSPAAPRPRRRGRAGHRSTWMSSSRAGRGDHQGWHAREVLAPGKPGPAAPLDPPPPGRPGPAPPQGQPAHRGQDLHRAGRQDLPPLPVRHADLPVLRPGRPGGIPVDPAAYDYDQAARDALTFAALFDRFIQNLRRYLG